MASDQDSDKNEQQEFRSDDFTSDKESSDFGALTGGKPDSDSGLGNLPPLSDFDSDDFSSGASLSGLPPLSEIDLTPSGPTGGAIRPSAPGFATPSAFDTPKSDPGFGLDTPPTPGKGGGASFQDLTADSDFSPETPEIGPGPDSDLETPMFDSAFGGGEFHSTPTPITNAPTQAMETPMFGAASGRGDAFDSGQPLGFDDGPFGGGAASRGGDFMDSGTPVPDFSPDTAVPGGTPTTQTLPGKGKKARGGKGAGVGALAGVALVAAIIGIVAGPFVAAYLSFLPNPVRTELDTTKKTLTKTKADLDELTKSKEKTGGVATTEEQINELVARNTELGNEFARLTEDKKKAEDEFLAADAQLKQARDDLNATGEDYAALQQKLEELLNQHSITSARQEGLLAEVGRLQGLVGLLEEANARQMAGKDTLSSNIGRLSILVREGIPLTPEKYAREKRIARVDNLKARIDEAKWITPKLLDEYTSLYASELEIAASREYFFARVPVKDRFGSNYLKWAECLMNGNWGVFYRTLDGKNIGIYENVANSGPSDYQFRDELPDIVQKQVEQEIFASRVEGFEEKLRVLAEKQLVIDDTTGLQRVFSSL